MNGTRLRRGSLIDLALRALDRAGEPLTISEIADAMGGAETNALQRAIRAVPWLVSPAGLRTGTEGDIGRTLYARPAFIAARAATASGQRPAAPSVRRLRGHAENYDGERVVYTLAELVAHGDAEFAAGYASGAAAVAPARAEGDERTQDQRITDEEAAWNDWRQGRAPKPCGSNTPRATR